MSPTMTMGMAPAPYAPMSDVTDRHDDHGVTKTRKTASTGGGRAWSEDEEVYLLQTRLQKMPYKHIAAHLKKTELACRLHYHQLSHGSNRRKRTTSASSDSSTGCHTPPMPPIMMSPDHGQTSRSVSPIGGIGSYGSPCGRGIQLPSIMAGNGGSSINDSPRLPAILPNPAHMGMTMPSSRNSSHGFSTQQGPETMSHNAPLLPPVNFASDSTNPSHSHHQTSLRLDCNMSMQLPSSSADFAQSAPVDMGRLSAIYSAHRASIWTSIAAEYGAGMSGPALEQAWAQAASQPARHPALRAVTPISPVLSAKDGEPYGMRSGASDKTRISAIMGIDADPRSPKEREIVRRMEERVGV